VHPAPCKKSDLLYLPLEKNRDISAPPTFLAREPEYSPLSTNPLAWLNLSHLENASVFVIVRTSAITGYHQPHALQSQSSIESCTHQQASTKPTQPAATPRWPKPPTARAAHTTPARRTSYPSDSQSCRRARWAAARTQTPSGSRPRWR
jgi:hypothetical protein